MNNTRKETPLEKQQNHTTTLKDKEHTHNRGHNLKQKVFYSEDVKKAVEEFVKELKQRVSDLFIKDDASEMLVNSIVDKLNKEKFGFEEKGWKCLICGEEVNGIDEMCKCMREEIKKKEEK